MELTIVRWLHIFAGIIWIGLLYYFNFVQAVALPKAKADKPAKAKEAKAKPAKKPKKG